MLILFENNLTKLFCLILQNWMSMNNENCIYVFIFYFAILIINNNLYLIFLVKKEDLVDSYFIQLINVNNV